ncbi:hypothetical protein BC834DRAFT_374146 [Gloeopeniophorella convolvens]|nr:hypothetical protein BC834DRAFT_374146 [Gloeopeniophorella convolvens]
MGPPITTSRPLPHPPPPALAVLNSGLVSSRLARPAPRPRPSTRRRTCTERLSPRPAPPIGQSTIDHSGSRSSRLEPRHNPNNVLSGLIYHISSIIVPRRRTRPQVSDRARRLAQICAPPRPSEQNTPERNRTEQNARPRARPNSSAPPHAPPARWCPRPV